MELGVSVKGNEPMMHFIRGQVVPCSSSTWVCLGPIFGLNVLLSSSVKTVRYSSTSALRVAALRVAVCSVTRPLKVDAQWLRAVCQCEAAPIGD